MLRNRVMLRRVGYIAATFFLSGGAAGQSLEQSYAKLCTGKTKTSETCRALRNAMLEKLSTEQRQATTKQPDAADSKNGNATSEANDDSAKALTSVDRYTAGLALLEKGDAGGAARSFLENYRIDPRGARAPHSLYKLGDALVRLGKPEQACKSYRELEEVYGHSIPADISVNLIQAEKAANCTELLAEKTRDATPQDFVGTWLSQRPVGSKDAMYSYMEITSDPIGGIRIWTGVPGMTGAAEANVDKIGNMSVLTISPPDALGNRTGIDRISGTDFKGSTHRLQGRTLAQTYPTKIYGTFNTVDLIFVDRNTLLVNTSQYHSKNPTAAQATFRRIDGEKRDAMVAKAAAYNANVVRGIYATLDAEKAAKQSERSSGGGFGGFLKGAIAGAAGMAMGASPETATESAIAGAVAGGFLGARGEDAGMIGSAAAAGSTRGGQDFERGDAELREIASSQLQQSPADAADGPSPASTSSNRVPPAPSGVTQQQSGDFRGGYCRYQNDGAPLYVSQYGDVGASGSSARSRAEGTWQQYLANEHLLEVKRLQWFDGLPPRVPECMAMPKDSPLSSAPTYVQFVPGK